MPRGRSARATRNSRLPQIVEMEGTLLEAYNHMDDLPRLSAEPKKRPRHVTRGSIAAERKAAAVAAAATLTTFAATPSPRVTRRNRAAATAAAAAIAAAADPKRKQERLAEQPPKLCCRVCLRSNSSLKIIRCAVCRKGIHTFCLNPPVMDLPAFGSWTCYKCKRKAVALKKEKRTILRDALVSYPTLCTNSFVEKIIHTAASVDAAAVAPKLTPPLNTNHANVSQPTTDQPANGSTRAHTAGEATDRHSLTSNPSDSMQHAQTVQAAIPFTRTRRSADQLSSLPAPVTDTTVVVRVPKELHLDQINPGTPKPPQQSSAVSRSSPRLTQTERPFETNKSGVVSRQDHPAPRPISIHQSRIAKPPTARRSQLPAAPKKRKLRSNVERDTLAQPLTNDASKSKENHSSLQPQSPKRTDHPVTSLVRSSAGALASKAPSQSPARRRSHLEIADITSSTPSRAEQMDSGVLASTAPAPRQHRMSRRHRSSLPLQKRYKYDVAISMEVTTRSIRNDEDETRTTQSPRLQGEGVTSFGTIPRSSAMTTQPLTEGPSRSSGKPAPSPWNQTCASQVRLQLSNNTDKGLTTPGTLQVSQTSRASGVRNESKQGRDESFSQAVSFSDVGTGMGGSRILGSDETTKEARTSHAVQRQAIHPKTLPPVNQSLHLGHVEMEHNPDFDGHGEAGEDLLSVTTRRCGDGINFAKLSNSASAPPTCYGGIVNPEPIHTHRSALEHVLGPPALNLESDMRYRSALQSSERGREESFFPGMKTYLPSAVNSTLITTANSSTGGGKQTNASSPPLRPQKNFIGAPTPGFVYPLAVERASDRTFARHDSGEFAAGSRDGRSWNEVKRNDATHADLTLAGNARKDVSLVPGANAQPRDPRMDSNRRPVESAMQISSHSLPEIPVRSSAGVGSCNNEVPMLINPSKPAGGGNVSPSLDVMVSRSVAGSINPTDIQNAATQTASSDLPQKSPVKPTNTTSVNVKDLQWEAKREALMAFAQGQRKHHTGGNTQTVPRVRGRDGSQAVRHGSRNRNVPETERHRMEITALAASSRFRYPNHIPKDVPSTNKGSISSLLQSSSDIPSSRRIVNTNAQLNPGTFSQSFAGRNYGPASSYDLHGLSEDGRKVDLHKRGARKQKGVAISQQRIYDDGPDNAYHPNPASFRGDDGRVSASRMSLPHQNSQMNTSYLQESPPTQVYESLQGNRNISQRPPGVDAFGSGELRFVQKPDVMASTSPRPTHGSPGCYGMQPIVTSSSRRNGAVQGVNLNTRDPPRNRSQGRSGQRLPSANNLPLPRTKDCGPNRYQAFNNVPNHARLAPVSFQSNGLPSGSSNTGAPMPEPMEMPPFGRPGDPIRYHDLPPTRYRMAGTSVCVPPDRTRVTQDVQRKNRVYMGRRVSNVEDVHQTLDRQEMAPIREPFAQNEYLAPPNQGNEVRVKDRASGFMHARPSEERRTLANPPGSMVRPRRLTTPYVQPETRRAQFEQGKALAFVGTSQNGQGLNTRRLSDIGLRPERPMLNGTSSQRRQRISNVPKAPELPVVALDYSDSYHIRRSRIQGSSSHGKGEFLGTTTNNTPRLGALPDAGMSLSNQIRALVSQNTGKESKFSKQGDLLQVAEVPEKAAQAPSDSQSMAQSDSARQTPASAVPVMAAPLVSEQRSKESDVVVCVTQADVGGAANNAVEGT